MLITRIWKEQPGKYFCLSTKSRSGEWKDHFFKRSEFKRVKPFIDDNLDKDLYWCPHGFTRSRRLKQYAETPKLLWADLDEANPREMDPMPTIVWESSPGRYACLWIVDKFINEEINRGLTYLVDADKGGWDFTQVLRVPGTKNYKYESTPRVRLVWSDGPSYRLEEIEKKLPTAKRAKKDLTPVMRIYKKYEKNFSGYVRRELLRGRPRAGKRSEVIWKLGHELVEAGVSQDEAFELLRASPWNKFKGRRDGDEQLRRELDKALRQHFRVEDDENEDTTDDEDEDDGEREDYTFLSRSMDEVEEEAIDWIWYPYLARGELTILEGDPGLGKSYLAQMVARDIVDGNRLPSVKRMRPTKGKVAYFDIENSAGSVTKRRMLDNGCVNLDNFYQEEEPFTIDDEDILDQVFDAIDVLRPTLVVFDTLNTYIGRADTHKASEVQQAFKNFREIAKRFDCSVVVLRHLTKSTKEKALYRGQGSVAFTALARVVMTVGISPDDEDTRVMAVTKINVARAPRALTFKIESLPDTIKHQDRSKFHWGEFVDWTADEIVAVIPGGGEEKRKQTEETKEFLESVLDDGPMDVPSLKRAAEGRSISLRTMQRVADEMGIIRQVKGKGKKRRKLWALP